MSTNIPRICLTAPATGSGKTTVTCALLQALINRGLRPVSFKIGPDYIDPMFHSAILATKSGNLDSFFQEPELLKKLLWENAQGASLAVIEGVMGYYDGIAMTTQASSYDLVQITQTPSLLIVDGSRRALSLVAEIRGMQTFRSNSGIQGVILNRISPKIYQSYKKSITEETGLPVLGYLPYMPGCTLEDRHLGLITAAEVINLKEKISMLAVQAELTIDIEQILKLAENAIALKIENSQGNQSSLINPGHKQTAKKPNIAVARDLAFSFYYEDSLELLKKLGVNLVEFSPLKDRVLPADCHGILLGGGYPELYAKQLSENVSMRQSIKQAINQGIPCVAECGGYLYLHESIEGSDGNCYDLIGAVPAKAWRTDCLQRFGYVTLTAQRDNLLCKKGEQIKAHEFHYWASGENGDCFIGQKPHSNVQWPCVYGNQDLYAGFAHLYFYSNPQFAINFVTACQKYALLLETQQNGG